MAAHAAAASGPLSGAGPTRPYVLPACPSVVSERAAASAMSRTSTAAIPAVPIGAEYRPGPVSGALSAASFWKKYPGRRMVNGTSNA